MTSVQSDVGDDGLPSPATPLALHLSPSQVKIPVAPVDGDVLQDVQPISELMSPLAPKESQPSHLLLPVPTPSTNISQSSFSSSDAESSFIDLDMQSPEFASADITVASDGSFVETSSGPAAREIKRRYDQHIGVGKSVRSPYAITAFVNQHGKQMYRVGHRELSAPAASAAAAEERLTQFATPSEPSTSPRARRRSRMSMHGLLPPSMFNKTGAVNTTRSQAVFTHPSGGKKLRKTRSIPDMVSSSANDPSSSRYVGPTSPTTGRGHSQSVTSADIAMFSPLAQHSLPPKEDLFAEVMNRHVPRSGVSTGTSTRSGSFSQSFYEPYDHSKTNTFISNPFGHGVMFDSPTRKPTLQLLPPPRFLREMQSFESGLTARQSDSPQRSDGGSPIVLEGLFDDSNRPPSAFRVRPPDATERTAEPSPLSQAQPETDSESKKEPTQESDVPLGPLPETSMISRYSTEVFDVLQTYRGLPLLEKLSTGLQETAVIRMSLSTDETAAPRNDPRFVIWGEIQAERDDDESISYDSHTDASIHSSVSRRRSAKGKLESKTPPPERATQKVVVAATIERWIAQLTSDLNYDELLDFFLTYRTYISAVDLGHLLICRFHWALKKASSAQEETVRRIVRVRTFVAIRYWLLTFFTVDFLPNRELRLLISNWLNALVRDPILRDHKDGLQIVRRLIKVAKECKQAHTRIPSQPKPRKPAKTAAVKKAHLLGEKFAEVVQKAAIEEEESDLDLDFVPEEGTPAEPVSAFHDIANAHLNAAHVGATHVAPRPTSSIPISSLSILQHTNRAPGPEPFGDVSHVQTPAAMPVHHGALSRAFVRTIGRLGRWKRVLNSRSAARTSLSACADVSAFDLELTLSQDLLTVNGGVEQYLGVARPKSPPATAPDASVASKIPVSKPAEPQGKNVTEPMKSISEVADVKPAVEEVIPPSSSNEPGTSKAIDKEPKTTPVPISAPTPTHSSVAVSERAASFRSNSTESFGTPITSGGAPPSFPQMATPPWRFDVVSIDDLDFSDTSSDYHVISPASPPGLRRAPRKLPLRRDFEFVQRPESVSSLGIISRDSAASATSESEASTSDVVLGANIAPWQVNALLDSLSDDDEPGDVEDALRRLEGHINPQRQKERSLKVDGWVRTIQQRMATGDYENEPLRDSEESDGEVDGSSEDHGSASPQDAELFNASDVALPEPSPEDANGGMANTPLPSQTAHAMSPPPGLGSPSRSIDAKPAPEDAVPIEILQSRMPSQPPTSTSEAPPISRFANPETPQFHRSFILNYRSATLAEHFAMIDRELFMGIKFEELVLDDWMNCKEVNVLDWAQYLKDRARWKAESRFADKTSALAAVRARFNLMANFTISETVLTRPDERPMLIAKFIRIAWKAYSMCNFSTLIAIITGLQSDWVSRAMRQSSWHRVGIWENRMFKDLKVFTSNVDEFKYIRQMVESIIDAKPLDTSSHAPSVVSAGADTQSSKNKTTSERQPIPTACIPFVGIYLAQLQRHSKLPDLIDPTAPHEAVGIDPVTSNFLAPAHPEVFDALAPLPPSMHLEPLINVHKQRRIAAVIKSLVAGQHLASRIQFDVDKRLFQKCLRLRGLDAETLERALALYSD